MYGECRVSNRTFFFLIELLNISFRGYTNIKSIRIGQIIHLISQFANDLNLFMHFDQHSWEEAMSVLSTFEQNSGMQVSYKKNYTVSERMGSIRNTNAKFYSSKKLKWTNDPINILGCIFTQRNDEERSMLNLVEIKEKMGNILSLWYHRRISLFGNIFILNSLITSLFMNR